MSQGGQGGGTHSSGASAGGVVGLGGADSLAGSAGLVSASGAVGTLAGAGSVAVGGTSSAGAAGTAAVGGSQIGGASSAGASNAGGTAAVGGAGVGGQAQGGAAQAGASAAGTAGAAGSVGSGGSIPCNSHVDCANPEPYSCAARCEAGSCKVSVDITKASSKSTGSFGPGSGLWDSSNRPWVISAPWKQDGQNATLVLQQLRADGTNSGAASTYTLPDNLQQPSFLTAVRRDNHVGVLWHATLQASGGLLVTQMVELPFTGTGPAPTTVMSTTVQTNMPETVFGIGLGAVGTADWAVAQQSGTPSAWRGYVGALATAPTYLERLAGAPVEGDPAFVVLGSTILLAGHDCVTFRNDACKPQLVLMRYSATDFSLIGGALQVSAVAYDQALAGGRRFSPALGVVGSRLAAFWNENGTSGLLLGRATVTEQGAYAIAPITTATDLVPKAIAASPAGGGILFAERLSTTNGNTELVAQRFDASLALVGGILVLSNANAESPTGAEAHPSTDGRILLTYRHGDARYSLIHADLCQ